MELWDAMQISVGSRVSVIGAGGKTTTILTLAEQSERRGLATLVTTTTKMRSPEMPVILEEKGQDLDAALRRGFDSHRLLAAGSSISSEGKMLALDPGVICSLRAPDVIICEADGAAGRSLKIHRPGEPVVPGCTTHFVVVAGLDAVGRRVSDAAHPSFLSAQHFGVPEDALIEEHQIFESLMEGTSYAPKRACLTLVLNKADTEASMAMGRRIAGVALMLNQTARALITCYGQVIERIESPFDHPPYTRA